MARLDRCMDEVVRRLSGGSDSSVKARRIAFIHQLWRKAVESIYGESSPFILEHTNAVYILSEQQAKDRVKTGGKSVPPGKQLVVYSDDSLVRSDLDARQEYLKIHLAKNGEQVASFKILPSRGEMKRRHPFEQKEESSGQLPLLPRRESPALDDRVAAEMVRKAEGIENPALKAAIERAVFSAQQREK